DAVLGGYTQGVGIGTRLNLINVVVEALDYAKTLGLSNKDYRTKLSGQYYTFSLKAFADGDYNHFKTLIGLSVRTQVFSPAQVGLYLFRSFSGLIAVIRKARQCLRRRQVAR
ncbi:MAG: hypothetical protein WCI45_07425, partial [Desulfuromonadales bacterium]